MSFRWKLVITYLLVVVASITFIQFWSDSSIRSFLVDFAADRLHKDAAVIAGIIRPDYPASFEQLESISGKSSIHVTIWNLKGDMIADSSGTLSPSPGSTGSNPEITQAIENGSGQDIRYDPRTLQRTLYVSQKTIDGRAIVRLSTSLEEVESLVNDFRPTLLLIFLLLPVVGAVVIWLASRRLGKSIVRLVEASRKIASGEYVESIPVSSRDEVGLLARRMEEMSFRLHKQLTMLESERNNLTIILNSMTEGVMVTDPEGRIVVTNPAFSRIFSSSISPHGRLPLEVIRSVEVDEGINSVLATGQENREEIRFGGRALQAHFSPIVTAGNVSGVVIVFHDVTELRRLETLQKEFISNVSHELKTPLTSIQGYAETLLDDEALEGFHRKFIERIFRNSSRLSEMIGELFQLVRLERGLQKLDWVEVSFAQIETELRLDFDTLLSGKDLELRFENNLGRDNFIAGKGYINRVFNNLVENAVKYTEQGSVTVRISGHESEVRIEIDDTGIGIPSEDIDRIFERFYRVDKDRSRGRGGSGIGLAIVRHIVNLHGGEVWAESQFGKGTRITFTIPQGAGIYRPQRESLQ